METASHSIQTLCSSTKNTFRGLASLLFVHCVQSCATRKKDEGHIFPGVKILDDRHSSCCPPPPYTIPSITNG